MITNQLTQSILTDLAMKAQYASSLAELTTALNDMESLILESNLEGGVESFGVDLTDLPTFGDELESTSDVYSYDDDYVLTYDCGQWELESRTDWEV